ncbi:coiled-coil domain-containing protein 177-like isoform X3 [Octopus sinensis]|uniref:Coiled-coil domain-containing protein 177-like isoform X3 n=1 Tax=Octopus sinensis TaxID=2607531 RepID=A0A7E6FD54_9MOLL|nr:coiled-coil domain-containing protein 177-like isoform X3 [Octopus sinensis]
MMEDSPKLTLYNFDDPQYDNCSYVLTSPRSLKACSRMGVKPVDLLYTPPTDQDHQICHLLYPGTLCSRLHNEQEDLRHLKLKLCLEERNRILKKEQLDLLNKSSKENTVDNFFDNSQMDNIYSSSYGDNKSQYQFHEYPKTAWMENSYEDKVSRFKFEERMKELREESRKLRLDLKCREKNLLNTMKSAAESSPPYSARSSPKREPLLSSLEKKSASLDSCNSRKEKLASRSRGHLKLTPKDQKILDVMKSRRENERACCQRRQMLHHQWEREKRQEEMVKSTLENIRRKMIRVANLKSEKNLNEIWEEESKKLEDIDATTPADDGSMTHRSDQLLEELIKKEEVRVRMSNRRKQKKKHQEEKLQDLTREEELMKKMLQEKQEMDIQRASQKKQTMVANNVAKMKKVNTERFNKYKTQKEFLNTQERKIFDKRLERSRNLKHQGEKEKCCGRKAVEELAEEQKVQTHTCSAHMKAQKAREDRLHREISHASNMKRINTYLELWKEKTVEHLSEKEKRLEEIQAAREQQMNEARASAHRSMILRNKLRQYYDPNNFDKKLLEAELYIKMGSGIQTAAKNLSSFSIS